jgi:hypothetical protein
MALKPTTDARYTKTAVHLKKNNKNIQGRVGWAEGELH